MLHITAAGRVGRDAELRTTQSGTQVLGFTVAADVGFGDKKHAVWLECSIWGDRAAKLAPYVLKGQSVTVMGEADLRTWEKNGKNGASITCRVSELALQGSKGDGSQRQSEPGSHETPADLDGLSGL